MTEICIHKKKRIEIFHYQKKKEEKRKKRNKSKKKNSMKRTHKEKFRKKCVQLEVSFEFFCFVRWSDLKNFDEKREEEG
jgi:hypothetical protein